MILRRTTAGLIVELDSEADTNLIGQTLAGSLAANTVIGLIGPLGAGKTHLIRAVAIALGVDPREICSPTFVLIHEYEGRLPVFHFDAFRLGGPEPFEALGVSDYWEAGGVCLVEWANLVKEILPETTWYVTIEPTSETSRRLTISGPEPGRFEALLQQNLHQI